MNDALITMLAQQLSEIVSMKQNSDIYGGRTKTKKIQHHPNGRRNILEISMTKAHRVQYFYLFFYSVCLFITKVIVDKVIHEQQDISSQFKRRKNANPSPQQQQQLGTYKASLRVVAQQNRQCILYLQKESHEHRYMNIGTSKKVKRGKRVIQ